MSPKVEPVTEAVVLGEGPHWDGESGSLYYVDVFGKQLLRYDPKRNKLWKASIAPKQPSIIIPIAGKKEEFLVATKNELNVISWDGKSDKVSIIETLHTGSDSLESFNDGKCDSTGRLWIGSYVSPSGDFAGIVPKGGLYSFDSERSLKKHEEQIKASNGIAFYDKAKKMYYIDTMKGTIDQFDFDIKSGAISNRQVLFTLNEHGVAEFADGMTIDTDGNVWFANFNGGKIVKIDGSKPETLLQTIELPAIQVTSLTFGGPNLDELYVTSGNWEFQGKKPSTPNSGATFRITGLGVKGLPNVSFKKE